MNITRSKYKDSTYAEAVASGYDLFQLKYDGNWCCCHSEGLQLTYYSDTYRVFSEGFYKDSVPLGHYIGEYMRGTQWSTDPSRHGRFFVFDRLADLEDKRTYRERYAYLRNLAPALPRHWQIVQNYRMPVYDSVWADYIERRGFEGVVYHKSDALQGGLLLREKKVHTLDGVVIGVTPGEGKHIGRMGALVVALENGIQTSVGNGFSDAERSMDDAYYLGRTMEITTNAIFSSGNVRHARFIRWREDRVIQPNNAKVPTAHNHPTDSSSSGPDSTTGSI